MVAGSVLSDKIYSDATTQASPLSGREREQDIFRHGLLRSRCLVRIRLLSQVALQRRALQVVTGGALIGVGDRQQGRLVVEAASERDRAWCVAAVALLKRVGEDGGRVAGQVGDVEI